MCRMEALLLLCQDKQGAEDDKDYSEWDFHEAEVALGILDKALGAEAESYQDYHNYQWEDEHDIIKR